MTPDSEDPAALPDRVSRLPAALEEAVLRWAELGSRWGVTRSIAQMHGLLYLIGRPMSAEEIAGMLSIARSNVSTGLRELMAWRLVRKVHRRGDRRDHFEAEADLWTALAAVAVERKAREFDPLLAVAQRASEGIKDDDSIPPESAERTTELLSFLQLIDDWSRDMASLSRGTVIQLVRMGAKVGKAAAKAAAKKKSKSG